MKPFWLLILLATTTLCLSAQKQGNIWYFGYSAGLDFTNGDPIVLTDGQMRTNEGVASICDQNGRLLFYTDGITIWNSKHAIMQNGEGLFGHFSSSQSAIIVPVIDDPQRYYVFTIDFEAGEQGLCYSIVNMSLDGGLGAVETKNVQLLAPTCEKLTAVKHCNGKDIWVITHAWNSKAFYAYLVTAAGVQPPVISQTGRLITGYKESTIGYMKAAPNGAKLALAHNLIGVDLFDFDNVTGLVSNPIELNYSKQPYGVEFSPNSSLLYVSSADFVSWRQYINTVSQYNVNLPTAEQIVQSRQNIHTISHLDYHCYGALQLAPNGKIYMAKRSQLQLSAINHPDRKGAASGFVYDAVQLTRDYQWCRFGLPSFIQSYYQGSFDFSGSCMGQQIQFHYEKPSYVTAVQWNFGDPLSGVGNTSREVNPTHLFSKEGIYTTTLIQYHACGSDTVRKQIAAGALRVHLGGDTTICGTSAYTLSPGVAGNYSYLWQDGSTKATFQAKRTGLYWVEVKNQQTGCVKRDSLRLVMNPYPKFDLGEDIYLCEGQTTTLSADVPSASYLWNTGATLNTQTIAQSGTYWLDVTLKGCTKRDSLQATFYPYPEVKLGADTLLCDAETMLLDAGNPGAQYLWQDGSTGQTYLVHGKGSYQVKVTKEGCSSTSTIDVHHSFRPAFSLGADQKICSGQTYLFKPVGNDSTGLDYLWQDGSSGKEFLAQNPGLYTLTLSNECGSRTDTVVITKAVCQLYIPNAFTPNGDGLNDVFRPGFGENVIKYQMLVYNRWGQKVFETNDVRQGWNGRISGKLQSNGVFAWIIRFQTMDSSQAQELKGTVLLIR